ncbi:MAG: TetR/AcrR family transcriptional regulator [Flavobacteriaceae bacterium]|nr:TetR/AcrR family transcriptional regulator [Flavobacteriaceae bacterium]MCI5088318.1 TetR/AcrR family transcriptional regulator [Flavobacteriaceae bacterium]CAI8194555.1 MAG: putative HTH-type transcriptional regulator YxaF [SAR116 cluster bacterium]
MPTKAEKTSLYIIECVAPLFNRHGYAATSLSDITKATGLTKGALYGNFKNKETLALKAYQYNSDKLVRILNYKISAKTHPLEKLAAFTAFYKTYHQFTTPIGGCPILNVGVDATENNQELSYAVKNTIKVLEKMVTQILKDGIEKNIIHVRVLPAQFSKQLMTMLLGAVSMSSITGDQKYLMNTVTYLDQLILREIKQVKNF